MWVEFKRVKGLMAAEMWKALYEGEGLPTRLLPDRIEQWGMSLPSFACASRERVSTSRKRLSERSDGAHA